MRLSKRKRFLIISAVLSLGFIGINFVPDNFRILSIIALSVLTALSFYWALREGIGLNSTLLVLILPVLFTLGVGLFWFLLPSTIYARIPIVLFYGLGIYALCATSNIYTVSAIRAIALMRAAKAFGFLLTLITAFLLFDAALSLRTELYYLMILIFIPSFLLFWQGIWVSKLDKKLDGSLIIYSLLFSLMIAQISLMLYFWPVTVVVGSLFLTVIAYVLLGLGQAHVEKRLFMQTYREYLTIGILVFFAMILVTRWT